MASLAVLSLFDFARFSFPLKGQQTRVSQSSRHYRAAFLLLSCVLALTPVLTWAQSTSTGTVVGLVTDPTGAIVPDATVSLIDHTTGTTKTTTSNEAGRYIFVNVNPGTYDITVNKTGFTQARFQKQEVNIGRQLTVDATLKVGTATQEVVVEASGTTLQTLNSTVGTTIGQQSLQELPNLSRDVSSLLALQPAIAANGSVAGTVRDQTTFQLDGGNNTNDMDGTMNTYTGSFSAGGGITGVMPTPVESIEEFKVNVANQTADFNGSAGAQVQMVTRRGGSSWHGAVYEYYLGSNFSANTWLNNHTPTKDANGKTISPTTKLPSNHYNRFGVSGGGPVGPSFWGGRTYLFANYEGRRYPQNTNVEKRVPSALLRAGVIQVQDASGKFQPYNLNPFPVTVNGVTYQPATCPGGPCDPRGIGLNSLVSQIWSKQMPLPNDFTSAGGDTFNTQGYLTSLKLPQNDNFGVIRLDHSVGNNWHIMNSYRYYHLERAVNNQFDIGGVLGGSLGVAKSTANRPQVPWFYVLGVTTNVTSRLTNDFHYSFLRNFWEWKTANAPPQLPGLGGALEIGGEACSNTGGNSALIPYCVRTQDARQRYWNGKDHVFRDDLSLVSGNHIFQFGGQYERNWDAHRRNDNGQGIMAAYVYQVGASSGSSAVGFTVNPTGGPSFVPAGIPSGQVNNYKNLYAEVLGIVTQPQSLYTRSVSDLSLQPFGQPVIAHSITNSYNVYFGDSWHMKPNFTLSYGLGYQLELPPFEEDGKQVMLVDQSGKPVVTKDYLAKRKAAALAGNTTSPDYDPILGFATIKNVAGGRKYPYDVFYGGLSPRIAAAWNPRFNGGILGSLFGENKTVVRGGYGRMYGRANGVLNILTPLLAPGLLQAVSCQGAVRQAFATPSNGSQCLGSSGADPNSAFRIGTDGLVAPLPTAAPKLPQPFLPGTGGCTGAGCVGSFFPQSGDSSAIDPKFRPNVVDSFDFTIQRELTPKATIEVGYIGRLIHNELQNIDLDAVPYMTTLGGQSFAQAYSALYTAICGLKGGACANNAYTGPAQPFFEAALGPGGTQAVINSQGGNLKLGAVYDLWSALSKSANWTLGRSLLSSVTPGQTTGSQLTSITMSTSLGYGNYNAGFASFRLRDFHGLTGTSNFTYAKALGTGAVTQSTSSFSVIDPWNLHLMYGPNGGNGRGFDTKFLFNQSLVYHLPFFSGQQGFVGKVLGGWGVAPLFTAQSGVPVQVQIGSGGNCQSFGEGNCASIGTNENAVRVGSVPSMSIHHGVVSSGQCGSSGNTLGVNAFADPQAVCNSFRRLILGVDTNGGGVGRIPGFKRWNMDMSITKETKIGEHSGVTFYALFTNVLNHFQPGDPVLDIDNPSVWGVVTQADVTQSGGYATNDPRQLELGIKIHF
jgi:hypothetical protein